MDIVFPDSTYDYSLFEFERKTFFPTQTDSLYSYDSAVYYLTTFEVDSIQYLKLPIFVINDNDSTAIFTETDSVILQHIVKKIPDKTPLADMPLKENTSYLPISLQFNYPYLIIGIILLIIIILLILIIFGKRIKKWWKLRRLKKHYLSFKDKFHKARAEKEHNKPEHAEHIILIWKSYMEKLSGEPYTKYTTKEIYLHHKNDELRKGLKAIDRSIYSGKSSPENLSPAYQELENYADLQYKKRVEEIKHD